MEEFIVSHHYFNSIKVQLELSYCNGSNMLLYYFNSIKVQLELCVFPIYLWIILNFNSIKVQLEHINPQVNSNLADISIP